MTGTSERNMSIELSITYLLSSFFIIINSKECEFLTTDENERNIEFTMSGNNKTVSVYLKYLTAKYKNEV